MFKIFRVNLRLRTGKYSTEADDQAIVNALALAKDHFTHVCVVIPNWQETGDVTVNRFLNGAIAQIHQNGQVVILMMKLWVWWPKHVKEPPTQSDLFNPYYYKKNMETVNGLATHYSTRSGLDAEPMGQSVHKNMLRHEWPKNPGWWPITKQAIQRAGTPVDFIEPSTGNGYDHYGWGMNFLGRLTIDRKGSRITGTPINTWPANFHQHHNLNIASRWVEPDGMYGEKKVLTLDEYKTCTITGHPEYMGEMLYSTNPVKILEMLND